MGDAEAELMERVRQEHEPHQPQLPTQHLET